MKYLLEYNSFIDTIDFADVTNGTKSRSKPLTEEQFIKIFEENCKNFSFNNTQLYRGVILKHNTDFFFINPTDERGKNDHMKGVIKNTDYNSKLRDDPQFNDLPDRSKCVIGSTHPKAAMITIGDVTGKIQEDRTFIIIPFDNIEITVAPILDLQGFKRIKPVINMERNDFSLLKYKKGFNIKGAPKNPEVDSVTMKNSKEVWTEGPCLLVRYSSLEKLKELVKQRY